MQYKKNIKTEEKETTFKRIEKMHPHKMLLYFSIMASCLIFFFMVAAYSLTQPIMSGMEDFTFPKAFMVSTVIILLSSFTISKAVPAFKEDNMRKLERSLGITLLLGLLFATSQYLGWLELTRSGIYLSGEPAGSYLYVISGLHIIHLSFGMLFLTFLYLKALKSLKDPVKNLIMVTNPFQKMRLEILSTYWHAMGTIWVVLFFYFLFTF
jgi:cytochrome c oxidase subunit III